MIKENWQAVEIYVQKIRFKQDGKIGKAELAYNGQIGTYHSLEKAREEIPVTFGD